MQSAVCLDRASVSLGGRVVLDGITADLPGGKIIGLLGPSGAGKTTLMRVIVGRQRLASGKAEVLSLPAGSAKLRAQIGYMTQSPSVYPDLTVLENLYYFAAMLEVSRSRVEAVLDQVNLAPQSNQLAATLSGGQLSRVSLATALLGEPKLLVLDEPTVGIDPVLRAELWQQFRMLAEQGITLLVSSHVMDEAEHCDRLVLLRSGALLANATREELFEQTGTNDVETAFLELVEDKA